MISNSYVGLLSSDTITIKHPSIRNKLVQLYRIIALKSFKLIEWDKTIEKDTIGGYVESIDNLDSNTSVWVDHRCRVFDDAKILFGSWLTESCVVFGNAEIRASRLKNYSRVFGDAKVIDSVLSGLCEVKDNATVLESSLNNSSMVFNNANIQRCTLNIGSSVRGDAIVMDSTLNDTCQIGGTAKVINCTLNNDSTLFEGKHQDQTLNEEHNLVYEVFDGELNDLKKVQIKFQGTTYTGYAWLIPGKSKSFLYRDKQGKFLLQTRNRMNLSITSEELFGTKVFEDSVRKINKSELITPRETE